MFHQLAGIGELVPGGVELHAVTMPGHGDIG